MASEKARKKVTCSARSVVKLAALSRAFLLALISLWRCLGRPYDTSALLNPPCLSSAEHEAAAAPSSELGAWLGRALESSVVWDGVYYVRIAECGYEYEQTFAFLPALPLSIRVIANTVLSGLIPFVGYRATLALSGYIISNVAFILSAIFFYKVSYKILQNEKFAFLSTGLFCLNPASIFYASIYSESVFSLLTFAGLWAFLHGSPWTAAFLFAISGGVRSNGVIHGGFLLFQVLHQVFKAFCHHQFKRAAQVIIVVIMQMAMVFTPFVAFQAFGYAKLCYETSIEGIKDSRPWCNERIPYMYGFVQSNYWNVGFLRYFELKQLPNFFLASPMLSLSVWSIITYAKCRPRLLLSLGLSNVTSWPDDAHDDSNAKSETGSTLSDGSLLRRRWWNKSQIDKEDINKEEKDASVNIGFLVPSSIPFLFEMAFMTFVACFIMHVQVATRFLSVCCPIYWFAAHKLYSDPKNQKLGYVIWGTFISYVSLGSLLFVNFYPFT